MTDDPIRARVPLPGISSRAWEHPTDRGALIALRRLTGFDTALKTLAGLVSDRAVRLLVLGSAVRVDDRQFPGLHRLLTEVARTLDAPALPELYVLAEPRPNSLTVGMERPFIVLTSGLVDLLDEEELRFVLGHELGHALSGHAVYRTMLLRMIEVGSMVAAVPGGAVGWRILLAGLQGWARTSELSADRAGLLAVQDPAVALRVQMQLASGGRLDQLDPTSFLAQAQEFAEGGDLRDSLVKLSLVEGRSHPLTVVRARELRQWVDSGDYTSHLMGLYPRREDDATASVTDAAREAAATYAESLRQGQETLTRAVTDLVGVLGGIRGWVDERVRRVRGAG